MNKETIKQIHTELDEAVKAIGEKYNFAATGGSRITYSDIGFTFKTDVGFTADSEGNEVDPERENFCRHCASFGLTPDDYHKDVRIHGDTDTVYRITGIKPKARKNAVIIEDVATGRTYVCEPAALDEMTGRMLMKGYHRCKYCGNPVYGPDDGELSDILCNSCRETFGHALYSEL